MSETVSHYRIQEQIGRGGMGVVYRAIDTRLGRPVAIKMLGTEATADVDRIRRFTQEARSASALNHPNIVTIYDIEEAGGSTFIAMELVEGKPLDRGLAAGPLPVAKVFFDRSITSPRGRTSIKIAPLDPQETRGARRRTRAE